MHICIFFQINLVVDIWFWYSYKACKGSVVLLWLVFSCGKLQWETFSHTSKHNEKHSSDMINLI